MSRAALQSAPQTSGKSSATTSRRIGPAHDSFEQEADRAAEKVTSGEHQHVAWSLSRIGLNPANSPSHRTRDSQPSPSVSAVLSRQGESLDSLTRGYMESRFGTELGHVRIHRDEQAAASASGLRANAYAYNNSIVFGSGKYQPHSPDGRKLLAHELAHVVQQDRSPLRRKAVSQPESEAEARRAADSVASGANHISIQSQTEVRLACDPKSDMDEDDDWRKKHPGLATLTAITQRARDPKLLDASPPHEISDKDEGRKGKGVLSEVSVPFERYSGPHWGHLGGGSETGSSRMSLARKSSHDRSDNATAGLDFLVEHMKTQRLVIGEQKAYDSSSSFESTSAITTSLETNLAHTIGLLQKQVDGGSVHPDAVAGIKKTIERLQATHKALVSGRGDKPGTLPEGVVFELTNVRGESSQIGKGHVDLLAEKYGKHSSFLEHLLSRTFIRDPALAKEHGRDPKGERGTDADPDIVPAMEALTGPAQEELARRRAGKSKQQWAKDKQAAKDAQAAQEKATLDAARRSRKQQIKDAMAQAQELARQARDAAREAKLAELREQQASSGEKPPATKRARDQADNKMKRTAKKAGDDAAKAELDKHKEAMKQQSDSERQARQQQEEIEKQARAKDRMESAHEAALKENREFDKNAAREQALAHPDKPLETPKTIKEMNAAAEKHNTAEVHESKMSKATHAVNQAAGALRAYDTYDEARKKGEGRLEAGLDAGMTYLENTNPIVGTAATAKQRMQKDASGQQYYGDDAADAWIGSIGETGAGYIVPGQGWDQAVNAVSNLSGAVDDHMKRGMDPNDPKRDKANFRTATDLAADVTPSRMFAQTVGGGARAWYDLGKSAVKGDAKSLDKFGDDAVKGKLGSVIQPWAMAADFAGNLGSDGAGAALEKTIKKTEGTTLKKAGDALGDAMFNLGQSKNAKAGLYGPQAAIASVALGTVSDMVAGKSFTAALKNQTEIGGDTAVALAQPVIDAAKAEAEKIKEKVSADALKQDYAEAKEKAKKWWDSW